MCGYARAETVIKVNPSGTSQTCSGCGTGPDAYRFSSKRMRDADIGR